MIVKRMRFFSSTHLLLSEKGMSMSLFFTKCNFCTLIVFFVLVLSMLMYNYYLSKNTNKIYIK